MLNELLQYGKLTSIDTINAQNNDGITALIEATNRTSLGVVKTLLQQGAAVDMQNRFGDTALHWPSQKALCT